jgi:putative SOS response-associated peptidase YedK
MFGMDPRKRIPPRVRSYDTINARAETIGEKRSFPGAWNRLQLCVIPRRTFLEPDYETGKTVRWRIRLAGNQPTAIAGLWRMRDEPEGLHRFVIVHDGHG